MLFGLPENTIKQMTELFKKYPEIEQVKIYGSRARGDYREGSDIDLACFFKSGRNLSSRLSWELDDLHTPYLFDVINYRTLANASLKKEIDKQGQIFYTNQKPGRKG